MSAQGLTNLTRWWNRVHASDVAEGREAYRRYNRIMQGLAHEYRVPLERVCATFVSLSPNADYVSNLRSTVSVLDGLRRGHGIADVQVTTYRHCLVRAWSYATGAKDFETETKGLKVRSFYENIRNPNDRRFVTVDGHMYALWQDKHLTMKEAAISSKRTYAEVRDTVIAMADLLGLVPCQLQATLWFARKRILRIKSTADQHDLFRSSDDAHGSALKVSDLKPYPPRRPAQVQTFVFQPQLFY